MECTVVRNFCRRDERDSRSWEWLNKLIECDWYTHRYDPWVFVHSTPFLHGFLSHSVISVWHVAPVNPSVHWHSIDPSSSINQSINQSPNQSTHPTDTLLHSRTVVNCTDRSARSACPCTGVDTRNGTLPVSRGDGTYRGWDMERWDRRREEAFRTGLRWNLEMGEIGWELGNSTVVL